MNLIAEYSLKRRFWLSKAVSCIMRELIRERLLELLFTTYPFSQREKGF